MAPASLNLEATPVTAARCMPSIDAMRSCVRKKASDAMGSAIVSSRRLYRSLAVCVRLHPADSTASLKKLVIAGHQLLKRPAPVHLVLESIEREALRLRQTTCAISCMEGHNRASV